MTEEIHYRKGENCWAALVSNGEVKLLIEEQKLSPNKKIKNDYPSSAIAVLQVGREEELPLKEVKDDILMKGLPHPYYGMGYDKKYIQHLVKKKRFYYVLYENDKDNIRVFPRDFFKDVANLIKKDKKVGWFQGRWQIGTEFADVNRCIFHKTLADNLEYQIVHPHSLDNKLFERIVEAYGEVPGVLPLNAYNPIQALNKLIKKEIDVLVMGNMIVSMTKEDTE